MYSQWTNVSSFRLVCLHAYVLGAVLLESIKINCIWGHEEILIRVINSEGIRLLVSVILSKLDKNN